MSYDTEDDKVLEPGELFLQILASIRKIDGSLDTASFILKNEMCKDEFRLKIMRYVESLYDSRMSLIYSLMDIRPALAKSFETENDKSVFEFDIYKAVKRTIR